MTEVFDSKTFLKTVTSKPGVYRMYDTGGTVIYVGKAKDLEKTTFQLFSQQPCVAQNRSAGGADPAN